MEEIDQLKQKIVETLQSIASQIEQLEGLYDARVAEIKAGIEAQIVVLQGLNSQLEASILNLNDLVNPPTSSG